MTQEFKGIIGASLKCCKLDTSAMAVGTMHTVNISVFQRE